MEGEYYKTKESVDEYIRLAEGVDGRQLIEKLQKVTQPKSEVLELGSGPGTDYKILKETFEVVGSDYSQEFVERLKSTYTFGRFIELDAVTLKTEQNFDIIYSNKVMHHLKDEDLIASIKRQHEILNSGGVVCHSFWKGKGSEIFKGLFVNYHKEKSLEQAFESYFDILSIETYAEFDEDDSILLIGKKRNKISEE